MADHYAIGEVLALLKAEFADITISKIRFLESQGLLNPERTASGYRRFYDADIEQLRWILHQQRENFLPLKVIRERIDAGEIESPSAEQQSPVATAAPEPAATVAEVGMPKPAFWAGAASMPAAAPQPALFRSNYEAAATSVSLRIDELADAAAVDPDVIADLEKFGMIEGRTVGGETVYDDDALLIARLASRCIAHGLEARHLRMYQVAAQREAGVIEQLIQPLLHQRDARARDRAGETMQELMEIGAALHGAMLRQATKNLS